MLYGYAMAWYRLTYLLGYMSFFDSLLDIRQEANMATTKTITSAAKIVSSHLCVSILSRVRIIRLLRITIISWGYV